jgi:hypothetical protein
MRTNHEAGRNLLVLTTKCPLKQEFLAGCLHDELYLHALLHSEAAMHCSRLKLLKPTIHIYPDSRPLAMQSIIQSIPYAQVTQRDFYNMYHFYTTIVQAQPKTSPTLKILNLTPTSATQIPMRSTTKSTNAAVMNFGLKIRKSIKCLLRCPAHIVVARHTTA